MPTREILNRLVEINNWDKIPKKNKLKKTTNVYYKNNRKMVKAIFIAYQEDEDIKQMCSGKYKGNVLLRFPNSIYIKKFVGKDKLYIDPQDMFQKDLKKMISGWKKPLLQTTPTHKSQKKKSTKKTGGKIMFTF